MKNQNTTFKKVNLAISVFFFSLFGAIIVSCQFGPPENSRAVQAQKGSVHFMKYCAECHGEDAKGIQIDTMDYQPSDLTRIRARRRIDNFPIMEVAKIIDGRAKLKGHGDRDMPLWGDVFSKEQAMTEDEIRGKLGEIIAYLMHIQRS